jgi:hypothetical protein
VDHIRLYALRAAARRLGPNSQVRSPSHVIAFRFDDHTVEIIRLCTRPWIFLAT